MAENLTDIEADLAALEAKLTATIEVEQKKAKQVKRDFTAKGKTAAARHTANAAAASAERKGVRKKLRRFRQNDKPCIKKAEFVDKCFALLIDNDGALHVSDLVGLAKDHFRLKGYSMACLGAHVNKYIVDDPRWSLLDDDHVVLITPPTTELK